MSVRELGAWSAPSPDDAGPHLWTFFQAVRSRKPVLQDAAFGHHAAAACHMANLAYFKNAQVHYDKQSNALKT
jgi:hypothetical protein